MTQKELDLKLLFYEMAEIVERWMMQMASLQMPVGPCVTAIIETLDERKKILLDTLAEMRKEGYPI